MKVAGKTRWFLSVFIAFAASLALAQSTEPPIQDSKEKNAHTPVLSDGTAIVISTLRELSSASATVGDVIDLETTRTVRVNGLIVIPRHTRLIGKVVFVSHPRRGMKDGQVKVSVDSVSLPTGEVVSLRPVRSEKSKGRKVADGFLIGSELSADAVRLGPAVVLVPVFLAAAPFMRGGETTYPIGTAQLAFVNGSLILDENKLLKVQPPPYRGSAQIYYVNSTGFYHTKIFCGQRFLGDVSIGSGMRIEMPAGKYWFHTGRDKDKRVLMEVRENEQYWIERGHHELLIKNFADNQDAAEYLYRLAEIDLTANSADEIKELKREPMPNRKVR